MDQQTEAAFDVFYDAVVAERDAQGALTLAQQCHDNAACNIAACEGALNDAKAAKAQALTGLIAAIFEEEEEEEEG